MENSSNLHTPLLVMEGICKSFAAVKVLRDVHFEVRSGEVHVLAGENGAGKSTLIKILGGVHNDYEGTLRLRGSGLRFRSPSNAAAHGIAVIHQEMSLVPSMSVLDNLFLASTSRPLFSRLERRRQEERARGVLRLVGLDCPLSALVEDLPISVRQLIEVAKALIGSPDLVVMDEPTSALAEPDVERLFSLISALKRRGCGIVYITHRMEEIYRVGDRITVLRDGRLTGTESAAKLPSQELIRWMVGRTLNQQFPRRSASPGRERLRLENFGVSSREGTGRWDVRDVSFDVRAGEVLGIAGLQGSGNSELLHGVFGSFGPRVRGRAWLDGSAFSVHSPAASVRRGLALLTNDRKETGLIPNLDIVRNLSLASLPLVSRAGILNKRAEREAAASRARSLGIRATTLEQEVETLSGGNQQKVVFGKWLQAAPRVLFLDEPTRGVDIGAKQEIYELMNSLTDDGIALVLITSEMPELLAMSDRIVVMHRGEITARLSREEFSQERILHAAMGDAPA